MHSKLLLAAALTAFVTAPAFAASYDNPASGDNPVPGVYLGATPQAVVPAIPVPALPMITAQGTPAQPMVSTNCPLRRDIQPGSADLTDQRLSGDHDPVPGVYNTYGFCG